MKKLKCKSCLKVWYVDDSELNNQTVCPFCDVSIRQEMALNKIDSFDKAIYSTVKMAGVDILKQPSRLAAYMMDTAPGFKKEVKVMSKNLTNEYAKDIFSAFSGNINDIESTFIRLKNLLIDEECLSEGWADTICNGFKGAIFMMKGKDIPVQLSAEVFDVSDISDISYENPILKYSDVSDIVDSGKCGNYVYWAFMKDGTIIIDGQGNMYGFMQDIDVPWINYIDNIRRVYIKSGVMSVGDNAFRECFELEEVEFLGFDIGDYAFDGCSALKKIKFCEKLRSIGHCAFCECSSLKKVELYEGLQFIGMSAFDSCSSLEKVEFSIVSEKTVTIGECAFSNCNNLKNIIMPQNLDEIGECAFYGCTKISRIDIHDIFKIRAECFAGWTSDQTIKFRKGQYMGIWNSDWNKDCNAKIIYL